MVDAGIGALNTPDSNYSDAHLDGLPIALDNGCFSDKWDEAKWMRWLHTQDRRALFAVVPDVVGDAAATRNRWDEYHQFVRVLGFRPAYVLQDGETIDGVPWHQLDAVFVGGSTDWKLSHHAETIVREAVRRGVWVHMGRVNSLRRLRIAADWGVDSCDGTYLAFGPDINTPRLVNMLAALDRTPSLFGGN